MKCTRAEFVGMAVAATAGLLQPSRADRNVHGRQIKAIVVDAFVIFDPRPISACAEEMIPGRGTEFTKLWRSTIFQYTWLRTLGGRYKAFEDVIEDALNYTAAALQVPLAGKQRAKLAGMYRMLPPWPDARDTLEELRLRGIRLAFLSDFSASMLDANLKAAKLERHFESHLTTDLVGAFKPSPLAYRMATEKFRVPRSEVAFAAFAPWDAAGAKWFGYPTVWVNRMAAPQESLDAEPDATVGTFKELLPFLDARG
jgi:2-haloacid dehalogenase